MHPVTAALTAALCVSLVNAVPLLTSNKGSGFTVYTSYRPADCANALVSPHIHPVAFIHSGMGDGCGRCIRFPGVTNESYPVVGACTDCPTGLLISHALSEKIGENGTAKWEMSECVAKVDVHAVQGTEAALRVGMLEALVKTLGDASAMMNSLLTSATPSPPPPAAVESAVVSEEKLKKTVEQDETMNAEKMGATAKTIHATTKSHNVVSAPPPSPPRPIKAETSTQQLIDEGNMRTVRVLIVHDTVYPPILSDDVLFENIKKISKVYEDTFSVQLHPVRSNMHYAPPEETESSEVLNAFTQWHKDNRNELSAYTIAVLFTGRNLKWKEAGDDNAGIAWVDACGADQAAAVVEISEHDNASHLSVTAHEIGHLLGMPHSNAGVMSSSTVDSMLFEQGFDGPSIEHGRFYLNEASCF